MNFKQTPFSIDSLLSCNPNLPEAEPAAGSSEGEDKPESTSGALTLAERLAGQLTNIELEPGFKVTELTKYSYYISIKKWNGQEYNRYAFGYGIDWV